MTAMLSTAARRSSRLQLQLVRSFATEHTASSSSSTATSQPPPQLTKHPSGRPRTRLNPSPRPASSQPSALRSLPPNFGQNQLLAVPNSTRALLEEIVAQFRAPIRYAFAYGSGVFEQDGYASLEDKDARKPMLDFLFAVRHPNHWHSINMNQYPGHYPLHARVLGSDFVSSVQEVGPGVWFNAFVKVNGITIKYGVTSIDNLCADLLNWHTLYLAGRMHKPLRIIKDDARVRLTQQVNLTSALRAALLTLPSNFSETELFERITAISYDGDPRMFLPAENRSKITNIVKKQSPQFKELYQRLALGLPGVHWPSHSATIEQDVSPHARVSYIKKLPATLLSRVTTQYASKPGIPPKEADESAFWVRIAGDPDLSDTLRSEMRAIVRYPAAIQTLKGVVSAGVVKSMRYSADKMGKWYRGRSSSTGSDK